MSRDFLDADENSQGDLESGRQTSADMARIPGGTFRMGSDKHYAEEAPVHRMVDAFWMDRTPVTNRQFEEFVKATGYVTFAEIPPDPKDYPARCRTCSTPVRSFSRRRRPDRSARLEPMVEVSQGRGLAPSRRTNSTIDGLDGHPVVHVAYRDAELTPMGAGKDLPTEAEWEFAARGALDGAEFAWGDELTPGGKHMANTWQAHYRSRVLRGRLRPHLAGRRIPAERLRPLRHDRQCLGTDHGLGIRQSTTPMRRRPAAFRKIRAADQRPQATTPVSTDIKIPRKVLKGGSHLCAPNYCRRYRPAARHGEPVDTSTSHVGFRCVTRNQQKAARHEWGQNRWEIHGQC